MNFTENEARAALRDLASALGESVPAEAEAGWIKFASIVADEQTRQNLVGAKTVAALVEVLFADALKVLGAGMIPEGTRFVDVGAGAGAPALPFVIAVPRSGAVLMEPRRLRVEFMTAAAKQLGLTDRIEVRKKELKLDAPKVEGIRPDLVMSRATFSPTDWLAAGAKLTSKVLVFSAADPAPAPPPGFRVAESRSYALPGTGSPRAVTLYVGTARQS